MNAKRSITIKSHARGFSLVAAIFLLVVLAALGAFMITIGAVERWTTAGAVQSARAYQAAEAGIEWGVAQAVPLVGGSSCAASTPFTVGSFSVTVTCVASAFTEAGTNFNVYAITSTAATSGIALGDPSYFSRTLQITVTSAP